MPELFYYGDEDADVELLANKINNIDVTHFFNLEFCSEISFTSDNIKKFLTSLENRKLKHLSIQSRLGKEEAQVILNFLNSPQSIYSQLVWKFVDADDVTETLRAIKNRYSFVYSQIDTKDPVSEEAEELAMEILDTHLGWTLYLNSKVKALRSLNEKGVTKYWW